MQTILRRFYQPSYTTFEVLDLCSLIRAIDYEVVSDSIFDFDGNEYMTVDEVPKSVKKEGSFVIEPDLLIEVDTAFAIDRPIDFIKAKKCMLGVIELLRGRYKGKQFLYPVYDMDVEVQLMGYEVLTTGKVLHPFVNLFQIPDHVKYFQLVLGVTTFEEISHLLNLESTIIGG